MQYSYYSICSVAGVIGGARAHTVRPYGATEPRRKNERWAAL